MSNLEDAPVVIELTSQMRNVVKVQIVLADDGTVQIVHVDEQGNRPFYPILRSDHASAMTLAGAILTGAKPHPIQSEAAVLSAAVLLLNKQLEEIHALLRVARSSAQTVEPL